MRQRVFIGIFPYDGMIRIRFTGRRYQTPSQPDASGSPKTYLFCDLLLLYKEKKESQCGKSFANGLFLCYTKEKWGGIDYGTGV